jgi:hypothetical protein
LHEFFDQFVVFIELLIEFLHARKCLINAVNVAKNEVALWLLEKRFFNTFEQDNQGLTKLKYMGLLHSYNFEHFIGQIESFLINFQRIQLEREQFEHFYKNFMVKQAQTLFILLINVQNLLHQLHPKSLLLFMD